MERLTELIAGDEGLLASARGGVAYEVVALVGFVGGVVVLITASETVEDIFLLFVVGSEPALEEDEEIVSLVVVEEEEEEEGEEGVLGDFNLAAAEVEVTGIDLAGLTPSVSD